jgi:hypothetical protein
MGARDREAKMPDKDQMPQGYRQAITTAITVFLGFSLTFLRAVWTYEEKIGWKRAEVISDLVIASGIILEVIALFRSLDVVDDDIIRYSRTTSVFKSGVALVVVGVILSISFKWD